ncbi:SEC-C metal-binding domain-containing protein [Xylanimonas sp. McL0601]|uniref:SEC-C metal-binding domain-containing protein n=1 Tax=Xylanimonas sp. McL0601 TaxID=3414739 RepID=UPI003CED8356
MLLGKGLEERRPQVPLSFSGPAEAGATSSSGDGTDAARRSRRALHGEAQATEADGRTFPGTPRNAQCPCGSGKKYKVCHGLNEA